MKEALNNYMVYLKRVLKWIYFSLFFAFFGLVDFFIMIYSCHIYFKVEKYPFDINSRYWVFKSYQNYLTMTSLIFCITTLFLLGVAYYLHQKSKKVWVVSGSSIGLFILFLWVTSNL